MNESNMADDSKRLIEQQRQAYKEHMQKWANNLVENPNKIYNQIQRLKWALDKIRQKDDSMSRTTLESLLDMERVVAELMDGSSFYG